MVRRSALAAGVDDAESARRQESVQLVESEGPFWELPLVRVFEKLGLQSAEVARVCTEVAKADFATDPPSTVLLASLANTLDPRPWRAKWYGFALEKAGMSESALAVLGQVGDQVQFSDSENRVLARLRQEQRARTENPTAGYGSSVTAKTVGVLGKQRAQKLLRVACIADEFTVHSFAPECELIQLGVDDWKLTMEVFDVDLLFIESAWRGLDGQWALKVSNLAPQLVALIEWCRKNGVPSVFWNKEDPVHYDTFLPVAAKVDIVFTTDLDCIPSYRRDLGHGRVYLLPFAAQPAHHHPIEEFERRDAFNFAGSYYLRYPERQRDFAVIIETARRFRCVEIFDRNFHDPHPNYEFPERFKPLVIGGLAFEEISKAYKGYRYGINLNTIKHSQSMFARRVFELMASNTVVVSNFSRGLRLLFGDLVISSDAESTLTDSIEAVCGSEVVYRKRRLAALRKVFSEHTYEHRLALIRSKVWDVPFEVAECQVAVVACVRNDLERATVLSAFRRQRHPHKVLFLADLATNQTTLPEKATELVFGTTRELVDGLRENQANITLVALFHPNDFYGPNYLLDQALAVRYSSADAFGKSARYINTNCDGLGLYAAPTYSAVGALNWRASAVRCRYASPGILEAALTSADGYQWNLQTMLALDEFNYCEAGSSLSSELLDAVLDDSDLNCGVSLAEAVLPCVERTAPTTITADTRFERQPRMTAAELHALLRRPKSPDVTLRFRDNKIFIASELALDAHEYVYAREALPRKQLNLLTNSIFEWRGSVDNSLDLRIVAEFRNAEGNKISHAMLRVGSKATLPLPGDCESVRWGLRIQGPGRARLGEMVLGAPRPTAPSVIGRSRTLVLTKQYPAYDDLYKYGFLHSRVRAYQKAGTLVEVFRLTQETGSEYSEFEGIDVASGGLSTLEGTLATGCYDHLLIHLLDERMWSVARRFIGQLRVTVWVHGAEVQVWQRREFEFELMTPTEIARQKRLSDRRRTLWRSIMLDPHPNLHLVFVSDYFRNEVCGDIGVQLRPECCSTIHNYIDPHLFPYREKAPELRSKVLSIRPYVSRKYANDLSVAAILELSKRSCFQEMQFALFGDGELFDATVAPLRGFDNVILERRFLTHREVASLHSQFGVLLTPTRMDAQGVSRDEAMLSGLVPVTTRVAAIPEFVDADCGLVVEPENPVALADALESLHRDAKLFQRLSRGASERVRRQSGFGTTIQRELELIARTGPTPKPPGADPIG